MGMIVRGVLILKGPGKMIDHYSDKLAWRKKHERVHGDLRMGPT